jgi:hypothetical protein
MIIILTEHIKLDYSAVKDLSHIPRQYPEFAKVILEMLPLGGKPKH